MGAQAPPARGGQTVLVITDVGDIHADAVIRELGRRGVDVFRLHPDELPRTVGITLELGDEGITGELCKPGRTIRLEEIGAAWLRRPRTPVPPAGTDPRARDYVVRQCEDALTALYAALDVDWVGEPSRLARAAVKPLQLARARAIGLTVPRTIVSNDRGRCTRFRAAIRPERCAVKPLQWVMMEQPDGVRRLPMTTVLDPEDELLGAELAPSILQGYAEKSVELRCVVVGTQVFAAAIHSQEDPRSVHDWRLGAARLTRHDLPAEVAARLSALVAGYGLSFASVDMVLTPAGEHVFLELNPNGQWLWLEQELGLPLSAALAELLCASLTQTVAV